VRGCGLDDSAGLVGVEELAAEPAVLMQVDPRAWMAQLPPMDLHGALPFQVTGQQLSVPATRRALARIEALFGGRLADKWRPCRSLATSYLFSAAFEAAGPPPAARPGGI
jgi:3-methyladenine DNA glycosylase/8-oxoguanine DNA glycosylase